MRWRTVQGHRGNGRTQASRASSGAARHEYPPWAVGCRQEPTAATLAERDRRQWRADVTGESTARGAAAPPTAVIADSEFPSRNEVQDQVTIQMPAEGAYLSVLRTATAGLAARLDFTLDEIEDLRIAVDEACGMLLGQAAPGANLECDFTLGPDRISIAVSALSLQPRPPSRDTFAWTVLSALAGNADAWVGPGDKVTVLLRKVRDSSGSG